MEARYQVAETHSGKFIIVDTITSQPVPNSIKVSKQLANNAADAMNHRWQTSLINRKKNKIIF